jgi:hypothetical protein
MPRSAGFAKTTSRGVFWLYPRNCRTRLTSLDCAFSARAMDRQLDDMPYPTDRMQIVLYIVYASDGVNAAEVKVVAKLFAFIVIRLASAA